ncbi:MAG: penicillin-binding protein activator [Proteobacteria bacterium]|nr:penicillin-binding protein activator [Pseudomonadota bacterium]
MRDSGKNLAYFLVFKLASQLQFPIENQIMKNSFKKSVLFLALFLFACNLPKDNLVLEEPQVISQPTETAPVKANRDFLESRDLVTLKSKKQKVKVALFLPFSGKNKELGLHLFNAATLSLFDNDLNNNIELVLIDSKDSAEDAAKAFKEIINQKIKLVIGPVFSSSVEAIAKDVKENNIVVISLSNNPKLVGKTTEKSGIFLGGILPEAQIEKITSYSIGQGKSSFAIIAPNNQYGLIMTDLLKTMVKKKDGTFIISELYKSDEKDFSKIAKRIVNAFKVPSNLAQGGGNKLKKDATIKESDRIYPKVIVIPESGKTLSKIVAAIKEQNTDERDFQIVGTSQWDDILTLSDSNLVGAWVAAPENEKFRIFEKSYYQTFNKFPPRITSIVYDSVGVIADLVDKKNKGNLEIKDFTNYSVWPKNGFQGIDGLFRFLPNGLVQRNLAILEVKRDRFETIDKPTEKFLRY